MKGIRAVPAASSGQPLLDFLRSRAPGDANEEHSTRPLPDEDPEPNRLRWMAGAADGVGVNLLGAGDEDSHIEAVVTQVLAVTSARRPRRAAHALYQTLVAGPPVIGWAESFSQAIIEARAPAKAMRELSRWLLKTSAEREPLKFGLVLCGLTGAGTDDDVLDLGGHEEFTVFAATAVMRSADDPDLALFELARRVHGWGRIHLVERLVESPHDEIKEWLLRGGYRNTVMDEYVAYLVAQACGLKQALDEHDVDEELLDSAGGLVVALLRGGPAQDIDDYHDGVPVITSYIEHVRSRPITIERAGTIAEIRRWLTSPDADWVERTGRDWTNSVREPLEDACQAILARAETIQLVEEGLRSGDDKVFRSADYVAGLMGIDTFERHISMLQDDPLRSGSWYHAVRQADEARMRRIVALAEARLPLAAVATGPADLLGLGPEFAVHGCIDFVLPGLGPYPGTGWPLVRTALRSPVIRNRHGALRVLNEWGLARWPEAAHGALREAREIEPTEAVRTHMQGLLEDGHLPPSQPFSL